MIRLLAAISAAFGALNLFLIGYPGSLIPVEILLVVGGIDVMLGAATAVLLGSSDALQQELTVKLRRAHRDLNIIPRAVEDAKPEDSNPANIPATESEDLPQRST